MAKQDVIDAINSTIVPNGSKAINADSLRNLLIMMTENAGEGGGGGSSSGDGALRVIVPELQILGPMLMEAGEFSPTSYAAVKEEMAAEMPSLDWSEYDAAVTAAFEHNAAVAQQLIAKAKAGQGIAVVLDQTPLILPALNMEMQVVPELAAMYDVIVAISTQSASCNMSYIKTTTEGEQIVGESELMDCFIAPVGEINNESVGSPNYPSTIAIELQLDGSLIFSPNNVGNNTESGS